ncbi:MAG: hypothetical protein D6724_02900 [Armatimonadetes bacterium]|nr:MAG: hypothetical protein D6724_02900 [Armatimonadota bacterium]
MQFVGWMMDIAREQSPSYEFLEEVASRSLDAGYNVLGLYLEHRFAYPSAPWAADVGALTTKTVQRLTKSFSPKGLRVIPFLNTLGHMEGFIRAEGGQQYAEGETTRGSAQICPSNKEAVKFVRGLVSDAIKAFDDPWIHLGGDEAHQLGQCPVCAKKVAKGGVGKLYGEYYRDLCEFVLKKGRTPCLWADMVLQYPEALEMLPKETILFDWQYSDSPSKTTAQLQKAGFKVVVCPAVHTYDATWCHLPLTMKNVDDHVAAAKKLKCEGVLVTTWEFSFFTNYASTLPVIYAAGRRIAKKAPWEKALKEEGCAEYAEAAKVLGEKIPKLSKFMKPGTWRPLRELFVMKDNPFYLWEAWRDEACGKVGTEILKLCDHLDKTLPPQDPLHWSVQLHRVAVEWVRICEKAYQRYAKRDVRKCAALLEEGALRIATLGPGLRRIEEMGGSRADSLRLRRIVQRVKQVARRVLEQQRGTAKPKYLPAFEVIYHPAFVPGDQAAWRVSQYK